MSLPNSSLRRCAVANCHVRTVTLDGVPAPGAVASISGYASYIGPIKLVAAAARLPAASIGVAGASVLHPEHCQQQSIQRMRRRSLSKRTETHRETAERHAAALV